jgi:hypothetical protein
MSVLPGADGWPVGWEHRIGANVRRFERVPVSGEAPIFLLKLFHPSDDWYGLSPMEAAAYSIDRWDDGNVIRIRLYSGALSSAAGDAVLDGAKAFAIEGEGGEWEVVQARQCTLVAPNEYQLSGFLRGQLGSAHAMHAPHPVGARIVKLDAKLVRIDLGAHEWGEALAFTAPSSGAPSTDGRATSVTVVAACRHPPMGGWRSCAPGATVRATCRFSGFAALVPVATLGGRVSRRAARPPDNTNSKSSTRTP